LEGFLNSYGRGADLYQSDEDFLRRIFLTIEKTFKIKFSTSEIGKLENVRDLVTLIKART
jgi:hypothetical protein